MSRALFAAAALLTLLAPPPAISGGIEASRIPDTPLVNQDGEGVRFLSQAIGDRLAAITFTFTSCHTICPRLDGIFRGLQQRVAADLERDTVLLTLSVDPANDIPERLRAHAEALGAGPGWSFLTGDKQRVNDLLKALEVYAPDILDHPPTVFVVDGRRGVWTRLSGFPAPERIAEVLARERQARVAQ